MNNNDNVKVLLRFMHTQERTGVWLDYLKEIEEGESTFDRDFIIQTLQQWYNDGHDPMYLDWIEYVKTLQA